MLGVKMKALAFWGIEMVVFFSLEEQRHGFSGSRECAY